jgi:hypothetical protein
METLHAGIASARPWIKHGGQRRSRVEMVDVTVWLVLQKDLCTEEGGAEAGERLACITFGTVTSSFQGCSHSCKNEAVTQLCSL